MYHLLAFIASFGIAVLSITAGAFALYYYAEPDVEKAYVLSTSIMAGGILVAALLMLTAYAN